MPRPARRSRRLCKPRRPAGLALLGVILSAVLLSGACGAPDQTSDPDPDQQAPLELENGDARPANPPDEGVVLEVPVRAHLEATEIEVGLQFWLEASEDPQIAALPGRALQSVGALYQPSLDSPTQETFWIHVYTDASPEAAINWVRHLASQPPAQMRIIVPQHDLFDAAFREAPNVGDASVLIELHHGHTAGCWRSALLVFAQNGVIVFMKSAIEVTQTNPDARAAAICDRSGAVTPLTNIAELAAAISHQLSTAR